MLFLHLLFLVLTLNNLFIVNCVKSCQISVDCDIGCINQFGINKEKMINIVQHGIYPFHNSMDNNVSFIIDEIRFHPYIDFGKGNPDNILSYYREWTYHNAKKICANILLTNMDSNQYNGMAYINLSCTSMNVGFVKVNIQHALLLHVFSHELGHILGLKHTCEINKNTEMSCDRLNNNECNPKDDGYLMYPYSNQCSSNSLKLSPCSIKELNTNFKNLQCLVDDQPLAPIIYNVDCDKKNIYSLTLYLLLGVSIVILIIIIITCVINRTMKDKGDDDTITSNNEPQTIISLYEMDHIPPIHNSYPEYNHNEYDYNYNDNYYYNDDNI